MTVRKAHKVHGDAGELLDKEIDPGAKKVDENVSERGAITIKELVALYIEKWAKPRKRSWKNDENMLEADAVPAWGRKKAKDITHKQVIALLDDIVAREAPIQANRVLAVVRKMFNFAVSRGLVDASPCAAVKAPSPENERDRTLKPAEIRKLWNGLDKAKMREGTRLAVKLQLVTAQRKGEVVSAAWDEIDLRSRIWEIPSEKSKNKLPHRVPLSHLAVDVLKAAKAISKDSPWVFPSPRQSHIGATALNHAIAGNRNTLRITAFVPHDLRRTAASQMTSMGIDRLVVGKILNHAEKGVTSTYDRHSYDREKRRALDVWGRRLKQILEENDDGKVVELKRA